MISCRAFAISFTSFWQELLPAGEAAVRGINLNIERYCPPMDNKSLPGQRALINEIGFLVFKSSLSRNQAIEEIAADLALADRLCKNAWDLLDKFRENTETRYVAPSRLERDEAFGIARRLRMFFSEHEKGNTAILSPNLSGCGFLDNCIGDVLAGDTLYEIKAGDRSFRLVDIRQVLVYLALNYAAKQYTIQNAALLNPRMGVFYKLSVGDLTIRVSGRTPTDLFPDIIEFVSSSGVSR